MFLLIYPQNNCMKLAEWVLLDVRGSAGTIPAMRDGGRGLLCLELGAYLHRVDVNEGQVR